jgi:hypothetical protein
MSKPEAQEPQPEPQELFPSKERHRIVRCFIEGFMGGTVQLSFITYQELKDSPRSFEALRKTLPSLADMKPAELAVRMKQAVLDAISTAAGAMKATSEERELAIDRVFDYLLSLRALDKIKGEFWPTSQIDSRLADLEDKTSRHEEALRELQILLRNLGGSTPQ